MMSERRAVVTLVLSEEVKCITPLSLPRHTDFAHRCGADHLIRGRLHPDLPLDFERLTCGELLDYYDRLLVIGADTLIRRDAPDVFGLVPPEQVGMVEESWPFGEAGKAERRDSVRAYFAHCGLDWCGDDVWEGTYHNVDVLVLSRRHKALLEIPPDGWHGRFNEQCLVNARLLAWGWEAFELGPLWNLMSCFFGKPGCPDGYEGAYIAHWASGKPFAERLPGMARVDAAWKARKL